MRIMNVRNVFMFASLFLLTQCKQQTSIHNGQVETKNVNHIDVDSVAGTSKISAIIDRISYIKLEQAPFPLGKVDKIQVIGGKLLVLDKNVSRAVFVFDTTGHYLYTLGGPGSGMQVSDYCINEAASRIYTYNPKSHLISGYNFKNGDKVKEINIDGFFQEIQMLDSTTFVLIRDGVHHFDGDPQYYDQNRICIFDIDGHYLKGYINKALFPNINYGTMHGVYSAATHSINISRLYADTIYTLTKDSLKASYALNLVNAVRSSKLFEAKDVRAAETFCRRDQFGSIWGPFFETKNAIAFCYTRGGAVNLFWKNKNNDQQYEISFFENDIDQFPDLGAVREIDDNNMISVIHPIQLLNAYDMLSKTPDFKTKYAKLIEVAAGLKTGSNPVIVLQHIKNL